MNISLQKLSLKKAQLCFKIQAFINKTLNIELENKKVLVALSGGIDSTALLIIMLLLKKKLGIKKIAAAHLNHLIRKESQRDEDFCQNLCRDLDLVFYSKKYDVPALGLEKKMGLEEAARTARYDFLHEIRKNHEYDWIILGHQLEDLAEDQLMRLIRGAGWPALGGMPGINHLSRSIRPLLQVSKTELAELLAELEIAHVEDASNHEPFCLRNRIRLGILPLLLQENPKYLARVAALWELALMDKDALEQLLPELNLLPEANLLPEVNLDANKNSRDYEVLEQDLEIPKALRLRLYKEYLDALGPGQVLMTNLNKVDELWIEKKTNSLIQFPGRKEVLIAKNKIIFKKLIK